MKTIRVMSVFGTRPEAIKMCPLVQELARREGIESLCCVTAQHRQMLDSVLEVFQVKPDWDLDIMTPRQTLSTITSKCLTGMDEAIDTLKPDLILVHGDTSTTFAGALSAFYHQVMVGHVEAGLRTYDKYSPFPEEMNRKLVSAIADLYFCPTANNRENLEREGITEGLFVTGNTVIDALKTTVRPDYRFSTEELNRLPYGEKKILLVTCHRRENYGEPMKNIMLALRQIAEENRDVELVYPVHLSPVVREAVDTWLRGAPRVHLIDPLPADEMHNLMARSYLVLTDSGGLAGGGPRPGQACPGDAPGDGAAGGGGCRHREALRRGPGRHRHHGGAADPGQERLRRHGPRREPLRRRTRLPPDRRRHRVEVRPAARSGRRSSARKPAADPENAEGRAGMEKRKINRVAMGFIILVVLVLVLMFSNSLRRTARITLPSSDSAAGSSERSGIAGGDSLTVVAVTPETVQTAIATLARPEQYSRVIRVEQFWSGGSGSFETTVTVSGRWTRTDRTLSDGQVRHTITDGETTYIWYNSGAAVFSAPAGEITADDEQAIPTYETILDLPMETIAAADYRRLRMQLHLCGDRGGDRATSSGTGSAWRRDSWWRRNGCRRERPSTGWPP